MIIFFIYPYVDYKSCRSLSPCCAPGALQGLEARVGEECGREEGAESTEPVGKQVYEP